MHDSESGPRQAVCQRDWVLEGRTWGCTSCGHLSGWIMIPPSPNVLWRQQLPLVPGQAGERPAGVPTVNDSAKAPGGQQDWLNPGGELEEVAATASSVCSCLRGPQNLGHGINVASTLPVSDLCGPVLCGETVPREDALGCPFESICQPPYCFRDKAKALNTLLPAHLQSLRFATFFMRSGPQPQKALTLS